MSPTDIKYDSVLQSSAPLPFVESLPHFVAEYCAAAKTGGVVCLQPQGKLRAHFIKPQADVETLWDEENQGGKEPVSILMCV